MTEQLDIVQEVVRWGKQKQSTGLTSRDGVVDVTGEFSPDRTEQLRRWLRAQHLKRDGAVDGSWRRGYELSLGDGQHVGVTDGYGRFRVYYRVSKIRLVGG